LQLEQWGMTNESLSSLFEKMDDNREYICLLLCR
jgi:hypothetical protein